MLTNNDLHRYHFNRLLARAHTAAEAGGLYSSQATRNKIIEEFQLRCDGHTPYD